MASNYPVANPRVSLRWTSCYSGLLIRRGASIAFPAIKFPAQHPPASFLAGHPGAVRPGRVVADVLVVAASKLSHPVVFFILVVSGNGLFHFSTQAPDLVRLNRFHPALFPVEAHVIGDVGDLLIAQ